MIESILLYVLLLSVSTLLSFIIFFYFYMRLDLNTYRKNRFILVLFTTELSFFFLCLILSNPFLLIAGNLFIFFFFFAISCNYFHQPNCLILLRNFIIYISIAASFFSFYIIFCHQKMIFYHKANTIILFLIFERFLVPILFLSLLFWKKQSLHLLPKISLLTITPPIFHTIICLTICYLWNDKMNLNNLSLLFFICLIGFICSIFDLILFVLFTTTIVNQELFLQIDLTKQQLKRNQNYYESVKEHITETHDLKADFYQKLHSIYQTAYNNQTDSQEQAFDLLDTLKERVNQTNSFYFCKNPIINTILEEYSEKANLYEIQLEIDIRNTDNIFLKSNELYTIFSFLLSDALEEVHQRNVSPSMEILTYQKANFFIIKESHTKFNMNKKFEQSRSYHQLILNQLVKKYNGTLQIKSDDFYTTILMFPIPE